MVSAKDVKAMADARIAYERARSKVLGIPDDWMAIDQCLPSEALRDAAMSVGATVQRESFCGVGILAFDYMSIHWYASSGEVR